MGFSSFFQPQLINTGVCAGEIPLEPLSTLDFPEAGSILLQELCILKRSPHPGLSGQILIFGVFCGSHSRSSKSRPFSSVSTSCAPAPVFLQNRGCAGVIESPWVCSHSPEGQRRDQPVLCPWHPCEGDAQLAVLGIQTWIRSQWTPFFKAPKAGFLPSLLAQSFSLWLFHVL